VIAPTTTPATPADRTAARRFELHEFLSTMVLSLATVLTTWAAYQSTVWSDAESKYAERSADALIESTRASTHASAFELVDLTLWNQWVNDIEDESDADPLLPLPGPRYVPVPGSRSADTLARFRDAFRPAFDAWLATDPFVDPNAPAVPFSLPEYNENKERHAHRLAVRAKELEGLADDAADTTTSYVGLTVVFASVLAFSAIALKLKTIRAREFTLGVAVVLMIGASIALASLPIDL
jgi:hypothetical protein